MTHNFQRPNLPYNNESLPNDNRFQVLTRSLQAPPTDIMLDSEFNSLTDAVRTLDQDIANVVAGNIPGSNIPGNRDMMLSTDGGGNIFFKFVSDENVQPSSIGANKLIPSSISSLELGNASVISNKLSPNSVTTIKILDGNVTSDKLADGSVVATKLANDSVVENKIQDNAVTSNKIFNNSVTTDKILDANVTNSKITDNAITTNKIADNAVTNQKILDKNVTVAKINSEGSLLNTFLAADGNGNASFINNIGRILQIVNLEYNTALSDSQACSATNPVSFSTPFLLNITPKKTGSKIILYYSIQISSYSGYFYSVVLCKDNNIWKVGTAGGARGQVTHGGYTIATDNNGLYGALCFSNIFVDTGTINQQITYELKKSDQYVYINRSFDDRYHTISTITAVEVDL